MRNDISFRSIQLGCKVEHLSQSDSKYIHELLYLEIILLSSRLPRDNTVHAKSFTSPPDSGSCLQIVQNLTMNAVDASERFNQASSRNTSSIPSPCNVFRPLTFSLPFSQTGPRCSPSSWTPTRPHGPP